MAGEALDQVARWLMKARDWCAAMCAQPAHLRGHVAGIGNLSGAAREFRTCEASIEVWQLVHGAAIEPRQARAERTAVNIDRNAAVELADDGDGGYVARRSTSAIDRRSDGRAECRLPSRRRLFGPTRARMIHGVGCAGLAAHDHGVVAHHRLEALRADVDSDDETVAC